MKFDQVVSLGGWCQAAYHIKRRFGSASGGLFDQVVTPHRALLTILEGRGGGLGESFAPILGGADLQCQHTGIVPHHCFMRTGDGAVLLDAGALQRCRDTLQRRLERFNAVCETGGRTLFVRHGGFNGSGATWSAEPDPERLTGIDVKWISEALAWRFPDLDFHIAFIWNEGVTNFEPNGLPDCATAHMMPVPQLPPEDMWKGSDAEWDAVFDHYA